MNFKYSASQAVMLTTLLLCLLLIHGTFIGPNDTTSRPTLTASKEISGASKLFQSFLRPLNHVVPWKRDVEGKRTIDHFGLLDTTPNYFVDRYDRKIPCILTVEQFQQDFGNLTRDFTILLSSGQREQYLRQVFQGKNITPELNTNRPCYQGAYCYKERYNGGVPYLFTPDQFRNVFNTEKSTFVILLTIEEYTAWEIKNKGKFGIPEEPDFPPTLLDCLEFGKSENTLLPTTWAPYGWNPPPAAQSLNSTESESTAVLYNPRATSSSAFYKPTSSFITLYTATPSPSNSVKPAYNGDLDTALNQTRLWANSTKTRPNLKKPYWSLKHPFAVPGHNVTAGII